MARKMDDFDHQSYAVIEDWAERDVDGGDMEVLAEVIATALRAAHRRGKAEGLREAADILDEALVEASKLPNAQNINAIMPDLWGMIARCNTELAGAFREYANRLEKQP
jgi:hypothetical protein